MSLPNRASLGTYGGPKKDYSAPKDSSTDRPAAGTNPAYCDLAALTRTALRTWARFITKGAAQAPVAPVTNPYDAVWNNGSNAAPSFAYAGVGTYTVTFPATVVDEIPAGFDGFTGAVPVNLRAAIPTVEPGGSTDYDARAIVTAPNVVTVKVFQKGSSTLVDPNDGTIFGVFAV